MKQFDKDQAVFLAKLGYVGLAVELFHGAFLSFFLSFFAAEFLRTFGHQSSSGFIDRDIPCILGTFLGGLFGDFGATPVDFR